MRTLIDENSDPPDILKNDDLEKSSLNDNALQNGIVIEKMESNQNYMQFIVDNLYINSALNFYVKK